MESPIISIFNKNVVFPLDSLTKTLNLINNVKPIGFGVLSLYPTPTFIINIYNDCGALPALMKKTTVLALALTLHSCVTSTSEQKSNVLELEIDAPLLIEFETQETELSDALDLIIGHLRAKNAPLDSLYLMGYQTDSIPWKFDIGHYQNFVSRALVRQDNARVDSILKYDTVEFVPIYIPPTGNLSGYERFILYNPETGELNDFLYQ
tara:strand:+ start:11257 stop:11880 length:624 start_codon:yes stop_codon:yes gene_type:complete